MRQKLNGVGLKFQFSTVEKHRLFIEGANKLIIESQSLQSIEAFDQVLITDTYLIGFKIKGRSGLPEASLFSIVKYIAAAVTERDTFEISPRELTLSSIIVLDAGMELLRADLMLKALFMLFKQGKNYALYRVCTTTYKVSHIKFNGNQFPQVSDVQYLEHMGVITISYQMEYGNKQIYTIRSTASANTLAYMNHSNFSRSDSHLSSHELFLI